MPAPPWIGKLKTQRLRPDIVLTLKNLAGFYKARGRAIEAETLFQQLSALQ